MRRVVRCIGILVVLAGCNNDAVGPQRDAVEIRSPRFTASSSGITPVVSSGFNSACGLKSDGSAVCWGTEDYGSGINSVPADAPVFTDLSAGGTRNCGITTEKSLYCWPGDGASPYWAYSPTPTLNDARKVIVGFQDACVIREDSSLLCWGNSLRAPGDIGNVAQVSLGSSHACAVTTSGQARCWHGDGIAEPVPSELTDGIAQVAASDLSACVLKSDGSVACWGTSESGILNVPADLESSKQITAGVNYLCSLSIDNIVRCWGGYGLTPAHPEYLFVPADVMQVSGGGNQTCAVKLNGDVICWGNQLAASTPPAGLNLQASPVATMTSASVSPVNQQYSDETNISATVSAAGEDASTISGTVQFKVDGANIGSPQPVNNGVATLSNYVIAERAGPHVLTAEFTSNNEHFLDSVSPNGSFFVQFEDAVVVANTTNSETLITGPSGTASTTLTFDVTELQPDAAGLNAHPGDASNLTVRFNRVSSVPFSSPVPITCTSSPSGSAYNSVNTMSCSTGDLAPGTYRIIAFPGERYIVGGPFAFVVTVLAPSTTPSLTPNQQYSDLVNLSAVVSPSASSGTVQFQIDGVNAGAPVAVTAGTATLSNYQLVQSAGTHSLQAQFISNSSSYSNSSGATSFEIAPEAASIVPSNGNPASVSAMAKSSVASVTLSFTFTETQPDQAGVGSVFGNLSLLVPVVVLHPISGGNDVQLTCTNKLTGTGYKAKIASTCVNASVLIGDYEIRASAGGGYYTGSYTSTVSVLPAKGKP